MRVARHNQKLGGKLNLIPSDLCQKSDIGLGRVDDKIANDTSTSRDTVFRIRMVEKAYLENQKEFEDVWSRLSRAKKPNTV